ncbi:MAG TPA: AmmeMemoRadiSam system radical SAM enzyme [Pirellulaceae bacterium]|nr:AmmeMemoRadiSam system radical SAM enzyme [Pirellulaceae bacterium]
MSRAVTLPPAEPLLPDGSRLGGWWHDDTEPGRIVCDLCPRDCHLRPGDRGFCFVRENRDGQMVLSTYGRSTGFCIDPIEKKPLNQFYPGTSVLSFGTAGCNLGCKFCQNWSISKSREIEKLSESASPEAIAQAARRLGCDSVAFTYNDPVVWAEYAIDAARACREAGVKAVAVTAGYITAAARPTFYEHMDAANVDLKGFTEDFYRHLTLSHLEPVKETLRWLVHESPVWTEITNLIIPRENDSHDELRAMCDWVLEALGPNVPVHFTAFHPDFRMLDTPRTPAETLLAAYDIAVKTGLNYVYVGNIAAERQQTTYCPNCKQPVIGRVGYTITRYDMAGGKCRHCGAAVGGHYHERPGNWGSRRQPVRISEFEAAASGPKPASRPLKIEPAPSPSSRASALSSEQEQAVLRSAVRVLAAATRGREVESTASDLDAAGELSVLGAFVSLKRGGRLRSCCGFLGQNVPLASALAQAARRTATEDHRFPPIAPRELPHLDVEVWLLSNQQPVKARGAAREEAVTIGRHGLQIVRGQLRGLLLPGVAVDHGLSAAEFLEHVCLKAELPPTAWREDDVQLFTFEGHVIRGRVGDLVEPPAGAAVPISASELPALAEFCQGNLAALAAGATPNYFAQGLADGNVHGIVLSVLDAAGRELLQANRLSLRNTLPLQSSLFSLAENVAAAWRRNSQTTDLRPSRVALTILHQPALHGTLAEPDWDGFDPRRHLLFVQERQRSAGVFDPAQSAEHLAAAAARAAGVTSPAAAQLFALECTSSLARVQFSQVPRASHGAEVRPAGVAGRFYPADPSELAQLVEQCLPVEPAVRQSWPALMVPHAGLIYSGRIAAQTLARVEIPKTVIVIGPKHTPHGVEWAVAPHATWSIPGATLASDPELARQLCEAIPGWQLDAAAHAQEHAIEVELPFLARLAPQAKVVGVALGTADFARCLQFAAGLAAVLRTLPAPPLLVISSDMNHFASDEENRRLDEIALAAMETLDPQRLYQTVTGRHISMCGLVPAVVVMQALRELNQLGRTQRVAYATSADTSGDQSRVVGYAGMLLGH